jgi:formylglycine-generating enzyme required for sulfatase activity
MSSLAEIPELVGFFSYSRRDDEHSGGALSRLRTRIYDELRLQLGRDVRLWQDPEAIPYGNLWRDKINTAIAESVFFIPIVTPSAVASENCKTEFDLFLKREVELDRKDLIFPILYIRVHALENEDQRRQHDLLNIIHARQYANWTKIRQRDVTSFDVAHKVEEFCEDIVESLQKLWVTPEERRRNEEAEARQRADEERRQQAAAARLAEEERQRKVKAEAQRVAEEERGRKMAAEAERKRLEREVGAKREADGTEGQIELRIGDGKNDEFRWLQPGGGRTEWFKDFPVGPEMVVVPGGTFLMGSGKGEGYDDERPQHKVTIAGPFAVGRFAITFDEWDAAYKRGGVKHNPGDQGWGRGRRPVINVSWDDAKLYINWLNAKTGKTYRLLSEAEREYVTRAGTTTPFWWGLSITTKQANYNSGSKEYRQQTVPVDSFEANPWGLFNVHGNVFEWCEDVWHGNYDGVPTDGSAWLEGGDDSLRVVRGGSWGSNPRGLRSADRDGGTTDDRYNVLGFRLAGTLNP